MKNKRTRIVAWGLFALVTIGSIAQVVSWIGRLSMGTNLFDAVQALGWGLAMPLVFSLLAALIIVRQPANRVG